MAKVKKEHYVNNKKFYELMKIYISKCREAEADGHDKPVLDDEIAIKIIKIAERISFMPNFINYTYRDEMIMDAIENCIMYVHKFNPEKTSNPFGYFSRICYFAFVRRIKKEKKIHQTKARYVQKSGLTPDTMFAHQDSAVSNMKTTYYDFLCTLYDEDAPDDLWTKKRKPNEGKSSKAGMVDILSNEGKSS